MHEIVIAPHLNQISRLSGDLRQVLAEFDLPATMVNKLVLIAEEMLANSCHHGRIAMGEMVQIAIDRVETGVNFTYCDTGIPFDIIAQAADAVADPQSGKIGGLGLVLIRDLPDRAQYRRINGRNQTELFFQV